MNAAALLVVCALAIAARQGQTPAAPPTPGSQPKGPAQPPREIAARPKQPPPPSWRERYTLGPGDSLNIQIYGKPETRRDSINVDPEGRLSYLHVSGFAAAGKTIDEVRAALESALRDQYREPQLVVTPAALQSKSFTILGAVRQKGVFPLTGPTTLLEALAAAQGLATGLLDNRATEMGDFSRSFIVRGNRRLPVDFQKLFQEGDLSQNVEIEPGDYIFIPSMASDRYYVLGAVARPGHQGLAPDSTPLTAVTKRGGFLATAYRQRILVLRGGIHRPERIIVNVDDVLAGKAPLPRLEKNDIVFVSQRPWYRVEQILDAAVNAFIRSATTTWMSDNVPNLIDHRILPDVDVNDEETETDATTSASTSESSP